MTQRLPIAASDHDRVLAAPVWQVMSGGARPGMMGPWRRNWTSPTKRSARLGRGCAFRPHYVQTVGSFAVIVGYDDLEVLGAALDGAATNADLQAVVGRMGDADYPAVMSTSDCLIEIPLE
jgi:hypothetical protein